MEVVLWCLSWFSASFLTSKFIHGLPNLSWWDLAMCPPSHSLDRTSHDESIVPYKTNMSERREARATSCLLGRIWGRELSPACVVSNNTGNEYDNGGLVRLICQSCLNQVKWHALWKLSRLSWCKCSRDMDRRNTINCSYKSLSPLGCLAANSK